MADPFFITGAPPFPFGSIARKGRGKILLYTGVDPLNLGSHEGKAYLLQLSAFDAGVVKTFAPPFPFGSISRRAPRRWATQGDVITIYPAATGNAERSTANDDVPAAQYVPGKLSAAVNYAISIANGVDPTASGDATLGIIELIDPDGELDYLRSIGLDGATLLIRRGDPDAPFSTYTTVAKLTTAGVRADATKKELLIRDLKDRLARAELHGQRYLGTGGIEGGSDIAGSIKPIGFGQCWNVTPKTIDGVKKIYQVSFTAILAIDAVKDGGVPLTIDADYPTFTAMDAVTPAAGHVTTCKALGAFKLGSTPTKTLTVDFRGDAEVVNGIGYPQTRAQIVRRIACGRGNIRLSDPADIDTQALESLESFQPAPLNYYFDGEMTKAEAIDKVMAGCAGWWTVSLDGKLRAGQLEDPAYLVPDFELPYPSDDPAVDSRLDMPQIPDYAAPRRTTIMQYRRNYTPMTDDQLNGAAAADAATLKAESSQVVVADDWTAAAFPSASVVTVDGGFVFASDATREGNRQNRVFRTRREPYRIPAIIDPYAPVVCRVARVTNAYRLGLGASRNVFIYGIEVDGGPKANLLGWA